MDLAKIRKKAQQESTKACPPVEVDALLQEPMPVPAPRPAEPEACGQVARTVTMHDMDNLFVVPQHAAPVVEPLYEAGERRDPLDILLSGRVAAGCDEGDLQTVEDEQEQAAGEVLLEFLCFKVSDEVYGINIMDIKEIIKPRPVTEVPRAPGFVSGIISLRGTIIPVIDMLLRLGLKRGQLTGRERVVVVKAADSFCGLMVDEVIQVVRISAESIEAAPAILEGIDRDFVSGIGRSDDKMVIILNLESVADIHLF